MVGFVAGALGGVHEFPVDVAYCQALVDRALEHLSVQTEAFQQDALAEIRALTGGS